MGLKCIRNQEHWPFIEVSIFQKICIWLSIFSNLWKSGAIREPQIFEISEIPEISGISEKII